MATLTRVTVDLDQMDCGQCGIVFAVPSEFRRKRLEDKETWFCPNGHPRAFIGETEAQKYKRLLEWERDHKASIAAERDQLAASLRTTKGVVTKMRRRAIVGVCQFCRRHFTNVERHVATKHSTETPESVSA